MSLTVSKLVDFEELYEHRFGGLEDQNIVEILKQQELYGLKVRGPVQWGTDVPSYSSGVYVISLSNKPDKNNNLKESIPVCESKINNVWLKNAPYMTIDGKKASVENVKSYLSEFWLPKENILYIGETSDLNRRVKECYKHPIGKSKPHSGGQWLHALSICKETFVYFVETTNYPQVKVLSLQNFDFHVQQEGNNDDEYVLPFANLEMKKEDEKMYSKNKINVQIRMERQR